ncbi:MAG: glycine cleavage system protein GcvH [Gammaproteobacteria bacterium]|nr:glycine cleavage system protein GcvH [Gammaproteobacteria bacterium]
MGETRFTEEHHWLRVEEDGTITVGITEYAQEQLGDVVYVELPKVEQILSLGDEAAVVESVKTTSDIKAPVGGTVVEVNEKLADAPELVNKDPMGAGWLFRVDVGEEGAELDEFMSEHAYQEYVEGL